MLPFATIHVSRPRHFGHYSRPCTCRACRAAHLIDELTTRTRIVNGFYFVLHFDTTLGQRLALAVCMCNSIDMEIPVASNARVQDPRYTVLIIVTSPTSRFQVKNWGGLGGLNLATPVIVRSLEGFLCCYYAARSAIMSPGEPNAN